MASQPSSRFGTWLLLEPDEEAPYLMERLGEEPLGERFTAASLGARPKTLIGDASGVTIVSRTSDRRLESRW